MDKKALWVFLISTFGVTLALIVGARLAGFTLFDAPILLSQLAVLAAMFVPAVSAIVTQKFVVKKPLKELGFRFGPWSMYAKAYALICLMFAVNYALVWIFVVSPDFTLMSFIGQYSDLQPGLKLPMPAWQMVVIFALMTFVGSPIFNIIPSLGEEIGWRGFLLPKLEPLGRVKASIISGMIWALWHTPMILLLGFTYGKQAWPGVLLHFLLVTSLGIWMGHVWFKTRSTLLSGFIHAVFNANAYGIWTMLFVSDNKLMVGGAGLIGTTLCMLLGMYTLNVMQKESAVRRD